MMRIHLVLLLCLLAFPLTSALAGPLMVDNEGYCHFPKSPDDAGDETSGPCDVRIDVSNGTATGTGQRVWENSNVYESNLTIFPYQSDLTCEMIGPGGTVYTTDLFYYIRQKVGVDTHMTLTCLQGQQ